MLIIKEETYLSLEPIDISLTKCIPFFINAILFPHLTQVTFQHLGRWISPYYISYNNRTPISNLIHNILHLNTNRICDRFIIPLSFSVLGSNLGSTSIRDLISSFNSFKSSSKSSVVINSYKISTLHD